MKQGSGTSSRSGGKVEPRSQAINPGGVAQLGTHVGNHATDKGDIGNGAVEKMHAGRGYSAPPTGTQCHHSGSQGKHR